MTDQAPGDRFHGRDNGSRRVAYGKPRYVCSARCRCGATFTTTTVTKLRDSLCAHLANCNG